VTVLLMMLPMKMLLMVMGSFVDEDEGGVFLFSRQRRSQKRAGRTYQHAGKLTQPPAASYTNPTTSQHHQPKLHEIEKGKREGKKTTDSPLRSWSRVQHQKRTAPRLRSLTHN
jgi:hypothetical protein